MSDADVTRLLRDLTRELQTLQRELDDGSRRRLPSGSQLSRFTSEVAIPGIILVLETNIRTLQLLRRTIRLADGRDPRDSRGSSELRARAEQLGETTLARLDEALAEVQDSLEEREGDDEASELLSEARQLQSQIREQLEQPTDQTTSTEIGIDEDDSDAVDIDVDAELRTLKDNLEDDANGSDGTDGSDESGNGDDGDSE